MLPYLAQSSWNCTHRASTIIFALLPSHLSPRHAHRAVARLFDACHLTDCQTCLGLG